MEATRVKGENAREKLPKYSAFAECISY